MACIIENEVNIQLFGDPKLQDKIVSILEAHLTGELTLKLITDKPYETKKGKQGQYRKLTLN